MYSFAILRKKTGKMEYFVNLKNIIDRSCSAARLKMYKVSLLTIFVFFLTTANTHAGWTPAARISDQGTSLGPRMAAKGDTRHVVYWRGGAFTSSYYLRSLNGGESWSQPFHLADTTYTSNNVMPVIHLENNRVAAIWRGDIRGTGSDLNYGFRLSTNTGSTWNQIEYILPNDREMLQKHTFYISDSKLFFIYSYWDQEIIVELKKSTNWGSTWSTSTEIFRAQETGNFDMIMRGDTIHVVWPGRYITGDSWETYYIKSENEGDSWSSNFLLTTPDSIGSQECCIVINENGQLAVIWTDGKYSPNLITGDLFVRYSIDSGDSWTEEEQLTFTHWARMPRATWKGDSIHIAWEDWRYSQRDIFYMVSTDNGTSWGAEQRIEDDPGLSLHPDVHVVWRQDSGLDGPGIYYSRVEEVSAIYDGEGNQLPEDFILRAYPNPFNSKTIITYKNLKGGEIEIYNLIGQKIRTFKTTQNKEGQIEWDARDALGNKASSGIYFARARAPQGRRSQKLTLIR